MVSGSSGNNAATSSSSQQQQQQLPPAVGERHVLKAEEELRVETRFHKQARLQVLLRQGSVELFGAELAVNRPYFFADGGGMKLALFTWHGCVVDVWLNDSSHLESSYVTDETACNVAYVNTHAQLEVMRDEAQKQLQAAASAAAEADGGYGDGERNNDSNSQSQKKVKPHGPRVLIVGPTESGKSSLARVLTSYAVKLGRTPVLVDLDPADNMIGVPGTMTACPVNRDSLSARSVASNSPPMPGTTSALVLWHGGMMPSGASASSSSSSQQQSSSPSSSSGGGGSVELFKEQVTALGEKIDRRLDNDDWERTSGIIVNTNGWIRDEGYELLVHAVGALRITVVLVMGHDRLYSMMKNDLAKQRQAAAENIKVIKVPRSGGVVSRDSQFMRQTRSRTIKRYFYGDMVEAPSPSSSGENQGKKSSSGGGGGASVAGGGGASGSSAAAAAALGDPSSHQLVPQLTPFLLQVPFSKVKVYRFTSMSLSASLLPVAAAQTSEAVQLSPVEITEKLQHALLAVCHPQAVAAHESSGSARDLYNQGVAGFCAVERVLVETEMLHLLSPCAGSLPSDTLLLGDNITWME